ncbi:MAG TPA: transglutaminase-like domain-containing protein [Terriglobales bacterium]|nr:transglutaminase-like domain-containing protein [Terriglobales bacterium]
MLRRAIATIAVAFISLAAFAQKERHFNLHYSFTVRNVEPGQPLRVWIPLAHSDRFQDVRVVSQQGDVSLRKTRESEYGNWMLYGETPKAAKSEYRFAVDYDVLRREKIVLAHDKLVPGAADRRASRVMLARFSEPDKLVPITGLPAELAAQQAGGATTTLTKAHALYDYVFHTLRYDKTGAGWGHGDTLWACDSKRGNCTDFHSLFISMARSQHIPARFEIGFQFPPDKHSSDTVAYHCWAEFFDQQMGWIPVDISEAWKHQQLHDYYFGAQDPNRVQFTMGRDLRLNPPQAGPPLNYFVYPYVEVGNQEHSNVALALSFKDMEQRTVTAKK